MITALFTHASRPGLYKKIGEEEGRSGRCLDCGTVVQIWHATFEETTTKEQVFDRSRLCDCCSGYDYSFVEVQQEMVP